MAKYTSPIASSIRGSVCGTTYSSSPGGPRVAYAKRYHSPGQSNSQSLLQNCYSQARSIWDGMTDDQRLAWIDISNPVPHFTLFQSTWAVIEYYRRLYNAFALTAVLPKPIDDTWALLRFVVFNTTPAGGRVQFELNSNTTTQIFGIIQLSKPVPLHLKPNARNFRLWQTITGIMGSSISAFFTTGDYSKRYLVRFRTLQYRFGDVQLLSRWQYAVAEPL